MLFKSSYAGLGSFQNEYIMNPCLVFFFVFLFVLFYFQKGVFAQGVALEKILKGSASRLVNPHVFTNYHESFFPMLVSFY